MAEYYRKRCSLSVAGLVERVQPPASIEWIYREHIGHVRLLASASVRFRWGKKGDDLPNATSWRGRLSTGTFSDEITNLDCTTYEFMAEAKASDRLEDDYDSGNVLEFTVSA